MYKKSFLEIKVARFHVSTWFNHFYPFLTYAQRFFKEFVPTILNLDDDEELVFDLGMWGGQHPGNDGSMLHVFDVSHAYL